MSRRSPFAALVVSLLVLGTAGAALAIPPAQSAGGSYATSVHRAHGQEFLTLRTSGHGGHYRVCVNPPHGATTCHRHRLHSTGSSTYRSTVRWGHDFHYEGPGRYHVSWHQSGHRVGGREAFSWSVCPPYGQVRAGVRRYRRLQLLDRCRIVSGTVGRVKHAADGDMHIRFLPSAGGHLVVEFMPRDRGHLPSFAALSRFKRRHTVLRLTGVYVCDTNHHHAGVSHGWHELHPVFRVQVLGSNGDVLDTYISGPQHRLKVVEPGAVGKFPCR